jgi:hypothetical protein
MQHVKSFQLFTGGGGQYAPDYPPVRRPENEITISTKIIRIKKYILLSTHYKCARAVVKLVDLLKKTTYLLF